MALNVTESSALATLFRALGVHVHGRTDSTPLREGQLLVALGTLTASAGKTLRLGWHPDDLRTLADRLTEQPDLAWRDYTLHPTPYEADPDAISVLCRSDADCEEHLLSTEGRHLTLGEAADWAREHHASWMHQEASDGA